MLYRKKILMVVPYVTFPEESGFNRFITIAMMLSSDYDVTLVTSNFNHFQKKHRYKNFFLDNINILLLNEPGYKENVGYKRVLSHRILCINFKKFLKSNGHKYDLVYSAYPLIYTNYLLGKHKDVLNYKLIIDVQDIWPEAISGSIPFLSSSIGKFILNPLTKYADKTYSYADGLVAVSQTYLSRANVSNLSKDKTTVAYIGVPKHSANNGYTSYSKDNGPLIATYLGTFGGSYDLETLVKAAALCQNEVQVQLIGSGPHEHRLKHLDKSLGSNVKFLGTLPYEEAMELLIQSHVALNAIKPSAMQSITNKLSDYLSHGMPILSCQTNKEVKELLVRGDNIYYQACNPKDLSEKLLYMSENRHLLNSISNKNHEISKSNFSREISYKKILNLVENFITPIAKAGVD